MSEEKVIEAVGSGRITLDRALARFGIKPQSGPGDVKCAIHKVRVQKKRDGKVYEDVTLEFPRGINR